MSKPFSKEWWNLDSADLEKAILSLPPLSSDDGIHPAVIQWIKFLSEEIQMCRWRIKEITEATPSPKPEGKPNE